MVALGPFLRVLRDQSDIGFKNINLKTFRNQHYLDTDLHCTGDFPRPPQDIALLRIVAGDWYKSVS